MKQRQIRWLIGISLLAMTLLLGIQYFLVQRTFAYDNAQLNQQLITEIQDILEPFNPTNDRLNSIFLTLEALAIDYKSREAYTGQAFIEETLDSIRSGDLFGEYIREELMDRGINVQFDHATYINFLGLNDQGRQLNTFLYDTIMPQNRIEGGIESFEKAFSVYNFTQSQSDFLIGMDLWIDVSEREAIVFRRMLLVLALAVGSIFGVIVIFWFTLRMLMRQRHEAAMQKDFINNITHEFKTPLATISLASKNLRNPKVQAASSKINSLADLIDRQNTRLQKLMDQAMDTNMAEKGIDLNLEIVDANAFIAQVVEDFKIKVADSNTIVHIALSNENATIAIDLFHFTTVLNNLLDNAVKYSSGDAQISIQTTVNANALTVAIADQGIGIDLNKDKAIFEKFYRVSQGNVHNVKGLGLGLFYVKKIVEAHQGRIRVDSQLGEGTTFTIALPVAVNARP